MSRHCMLCMAKVFEGKFLRENFEKWLNLVRFGVYFDQMFLKIIPKINIFMDNHCYHIKNGSKSNTNSQLQSQFSPRI